MRVYNLAKQALAKKLTVGAGLSCLAVHPSGDHVITGTEVGPCSFPQPASTIMGIGKQILGSYCCGDDLPATPLIGPWLAPACGACGACGCAMYCRGPRSLFVEKSICS